MVRVNCKGPAAYAGVFVLYPQKIHQNHVILYTF